MYLFVHCNALEVSPPQKSLILNPDFDQLTLNSGREISYFNAGLSWGNIFKFGVPCTQQDTDLKPLVRNSLKSEKRLGFGSVRKKFGLRHIFWTLNRFPLLCRNSHPALPSLHLEYRFRDYATRWSPHPNYSNIDTTTFGSVNIEVIVHNAGWFFKTTFRVSITRPPVPVQILLNFEQNLSIIFHAILGSTQQRQQHQTLETDNFKSLF